MFPCNVEMYININYGKYLYEFVQFLSLISVLHVLVNTSSFTKIKLKIVQEIYTSTMVSKASKTTSTVDDN